MTDHSHFEERIRVGVQTGSWDPETSEHLRTCPACAEQAEVARFMNTLAEAGMSAAPPDAQVVKLKAQIVNRGKLDEETVHRISHLQRFVWGAIALAWLAVLAFNWSRLTVWLENFDLGEIVFSSVTGRGDGSLGLLLLIVSLGSITAMVAVHAIFSEE